LAASFSWNIELSSSFTHQNPNSFHMDVAGCGPQNISPGVCHRLMLDHFGAEDLAFGQESKVGCPALDFVTRVADAIFMANAVRDLELELSPPTAFIGQPGGFQLRFRANGRIPRVS
jgi:hypothetical protein